MVAVPHVHSGRRTPVFHVVSDAATADGDEARRWVVRREGDQRIHRFADRRTAADFARGLGRAAGAYRLFLELRDGRMMCEMLNVAS
ncbi:DUF2188 domain-containing protein [Caenispirillum bisanense]|uniref:Uncharacterized protein n=1 Tax=Caenispirillum bisanense TaxID=414052 RepID=A0A286GKU6_9PROT|nr:DUF2188 domain-containing protein [Caenispirillum bisanense]SOD96132.1 hypothetical protein SAMN05421508_105171 [Caenispirillum bisanense]